ncbi:hypothetical protein CAOG_004069 [Capsaspora owczarzaki ATCC 30864]|uniref:Uncharacterized protein n=1 Tax=Capsaspora owczarzaki (strain ATCC 30864) TaxID=595528 RepID=A0A0D2VR02_CAPO3|nr:hypothetical protein CAOG_004069 [Capsaspora owczarzaki ATCC 30864]
MGRSSSVRGTSRSASSLAALTEDAADAASSASYQQHQQHYFGTSELSPPQRQAVGGYGGSQPALVAATPNVSPSSPFRPRAMTLPSMPHQPIVLGATHALDYAAAAPDTAEQQAGLTASSRAGPTQQLSAWLERHHNPTQERLARLGGGDASTMLLPPPREADETDELAYLEQANLSMVPDAVAANAADAVAVGTMQLQPFLFDAASVVVNMNLDATASGGEEDQAGASEAAVFGRTPLQRSQARRNHPRPTAAAAAAGGSAPYNVTANAVASASYASRPGVDYYGEHDYGTFSSTMHGGGLAATSSKIRPSAAPRQRRQAVSPNCPYLSQFKEQQFRKMCEAGNYLEVLELINSGVNVNAADTKKRTALHFACSRGHKTVVELLISRGVRLNASDVNGNTALHLASVMHKTEIITLLLKAGCDANALDAFGKTPIHYAKGRIALLRRQVIQPEDVSKAYKHLQEIVDLLRAYMARQQQEGTSELDELAAQLEGVSTKDDFDELSDLLDGFMTMSLSRQGFTTMMGELTIESVVATSHEGLKSAVKAGEKQQRAELKQQQDQLLMIQQQQTQEQQQQQQFQSDAFGLALQPKPQDLSNKLALELEPQQLLSPSHSHPNSQFVDPVAFQ